MWMVEINQSEIAIFSSIGDRFDRVAMFFCCTNEWRTHSGAGILTPCCDLRQWQNAKVFGKKSRTNCLRGRQASAREIEVDLVRGRSKGQNNIRRDQTVQHIVIGEFCRMVNFQAKLGVHSAISLSIMETVEKPQLKHILWQTCTSRSWS